MIEYLVVVTSERNGKWETTVATKRGAFAAVEMAMHKYVTLGLTNADTIEVKPR